MSAVGPSRSFRRRRSVSRFRTSSGSRTTVRGLQAFADFRVSMSIGRPGESRILQQPPERFEAQASVADVLVAIDPAAARPLRVVRVEHAQPVEPDEPPKRLERLAVAVRRDDVVAGRDEVAGVEAHAGARRSVEVLDDGGQVLEAMPDRPALAGGVLEQHHRPAAAAGRGTRCRDGIGDETQRVVHRSRRARAGMQHHAEQSQRVRAIELIDERGNRQLAQRRVLSSRD